MPHALRMVLGEHGENLTRDLEHALGLGPPPARCRRVGRHDGYLRVCGFRITDPGDGRVFGTGAIAPPPPPAGRGRLFDDAGDISTGSATLQRSLVAALGACGCRPTGRLWRVAELLTRGSAIAGRRCDQRRPGAPGVRAGVGPVASSAGGKRDGLGGAARTPGAFGVPAGPARQARGIARNSQGPCASSATPNLGTMPCTWLCARTGIRSSRWEDAPGSGRCLGRFGALCHWMAFPLVNY